ELDRRRRVGEGRVRGAEPGEVIEGPGVVRLGRGEPAVATMVVDNPPPQVTGWLAIDDDQAKQRRRQNYQFTLDWCPTTRCEPQDWQPLVKRRIRHRPGRVWFSPAIPGPSSTAGSLRATIISDGPGAPQMGFNLDLTGETWPGQEAE
ncbi:MAG: hypothetical protein ACPG4T_22010, partial [Nannocystaceae bacterium]